MSQLRHSASWRQNKAAKTETEGGQFKPAQIRLHKELKISSCCDVGCQNRCSRGSNLTFLRITAARQKKRRLWLNEIKQADWTETIDKNAHSCSVHL